MCTKYILETQSTHYIQYWVSHFGLVRGINAKKHIICVCTHSLFVDKMADFLREQTLDEFVEVFRENGINGEILEAILARNDNKVLVQNKKGEITMVVTDIILIELGMKMAIQRLKVKRKFRRFTDSIVSIRSSF